MKTVDEILTEIRMPGQFGRTFEPGMLAAFLHDQQRQIEDLKFMVRTFGSVLHAAASDFPVSFNLEIDGVLQKVAELGPDLDDEMRKRWKSLTNRAETE